MAQTLEKYSRISRFRLQDVQTNSVGSVAHLPMSNAAPTPGMPVQISYTNESKLQVREDMDHCLSCTHELR
jgi:hypothetical protein